MLRRRERRMIDGWARKYLLEVDCACAIVNGSLGVIAVAGAAATSGRRYENDNSHGWR